MRINTNIPSLQAQNALTKTSRAIARSLERLSTGQRINSGKDDPAGLAVGTRLESESRGLSRSLQNLSEAQGILSTADSAIESLTELVQRMREIALQSANGTLSATDRASLDQEVQSLYAEYQRTVAQTNFNGTKLLDGSFGSQNIQVGQNKSDTIALGLNDLSAAKVFTKTTGTGTFTNLTDGKGNSEVAKITINDAAGINDGTYFDLYDPLIGHLYFYFMIDNSDNDPGASGIPVAVNINSGATEDEVASDLATALQSVGLQTSVNSNEVTITLNAGATQDMKDATVGGGISIQTLTQGSGSANYASVGSGPSSSPQLQDLNSDGYLDIIQLNRFSNDISVLLGSATGQFTNVATLSIGTNPLNPPAIGDINGDGKLDIIQSNNGTNNISIFLGTGTGNFTRGTTLTVGSGPYASPLLGDINGDGKLDIIQANMNTFSASVFLNNGSGGFTQGTTVNFNGMPNSTGWLVDMNGDGKLDIVQTQDTNGPSNLSVYLGNGNGTFATTSNFSVGNYANYAPLIVDINGDGRLDLLQGSQASAISVFLNAGAGAFTRAATLTIGAGGGTTPVAGDFNKDGKMDILASNPGGTISVFLGTGSGTFTTGTTLNAGSNPGTSPSVADLNGDGILDIAQADSAGGNVLIFLGNGSGGFNLRASYNTGYMGAGSPVLADLNGDGALDFLQSGYISSRVAVYFQNTTESDLQSNSDISVATQSNAQNLLSILDNAMTNLTNARASVGALQSRLESTQNVMQIQREAIATARSQMIDADIATETAELIRLQILQQAQIAVTSQANASLQLALQLLKF